MQASRYIPDIVKLMQLLQEKLNQHEDIEAIKKMIIKDFISKQIQGGKLRNIVIII